VPDGGVTAAWTPDNAPKAVAESGYDSPQMIIVVFVSRATAIRRSPVMTMTAKLSALLNL
jgi:hypothetical protein